MTARREIGKWLNEQQNREVDRVALAELCAEHDRMAHALATLLGETEDSDYMSAAEQRAMARRALPPNAELRGRTLADGPVERSGTNLSAGLGGADIGDSK